MTTQMIFRSLLAVGLAGVAAYLAANGKDGWGWFLFASVLVVG